jgi:cbb3-type cytochrome oxidase maturation protein
MTVLYFMIPMSLILGFGFVGAFIWSVAAGQWDDVETPAYRILDLDEEERK